MTRLLFTVSLLLLLATGAAAQTAAPAVSPQTDEGDVLRHVLDRYVQHRHGEIGKTLLLAVSINPSDLQPQQASVSRSGAPQDLVEKTRLSFADEPLHFGAVRSPFAVVTKRDLEGLRSVNAAGQEQWNWPRFGELYPNSGGILEFSVPVFDAPRQIAVLYLRHRCGEYCGETYLYCLVRTSDGWTIATDLALSSEPSRPRVDPGVPAPAPHLQREH